MKANLKAAHRINLLTILPQEGDFVTLRVLRDLTAVLSFTEEEHARLEFVHKGEMVNWNAAKDEAVEFNFEPKALSIILKALEEREKSKRLTLATMELYEMFIQPTSKE